MLSEVIIDNELNLKPECIFSCDETILNLNKNTQKVIVPKTLRNAHSRNVSSSEHTTIHVCVNAAGNAMPPMNFFKASMPGGKYSDQGHWQALYGKSRSGFMDGELFLKWFELPICSKGASISAKSCSATSRWSRVTLHGGADETVSNAITLSFLLVHRIQHTSVSLWMLRSSNL